MQLIGGLIHLAAESKAFRFAILHRDANFHHVSFASAFGRSVNRCWMEDFRTYLLDRAPAEKRRFCFLFWGAGVFLSSVVLSCHYDLSLRGKRLSFVTAPPLMALHLSVGQNQWYHLEVGAPPILVQFSGDWDVHWGYGLLTHGHIDALAS